jgi:hypothetical protein
MPASSRFALHFKDGSQQYRCNTDMLSNHTTKDETEYFALYSFVVPEHR